MNWLLCKLWYHRFSVPLSRSLNQIKHWNLVACVFTRFRQCGCFHLMVSWPLKGFSSLLIGCCDHFGFGFATLSRIALYRIKEGRFSVRRCTTSFIILLPNIIFFQCIFYCLEFVPLPRVFFLVTKSPWRHLAGFYRNKAEKNVLDVLTLQLTD